MNKTFGWLVLLSTLVVVACTDKLNTRVEPPDDLIARDTMIDILVDLRLMDAALVQEQRQSNPKAYDIKYFMYLSILDHYKITREQFISSFDYYQSNLDEMDEMFAESITRLTKIKNDLKKEE